MAGMSPVFLFFSLSEKMRSLKLILFKSNIVLFDNQKKKHSEPPPIVLPLDLLITYLQVPKLVLLPVIL